MGQLRDSHRRGVPRDQSRADTVGGLNKVMIIGNLGRDPEMRQVGAQNVTNFSVATSRKWTNKQSGELVEETTWYRVSVWGRQAETANQYLSQGKKVLVEGSSLKARSYANQDGTTGVSLDLRADVVRFLSARGEDEGGTAPAQRPAATSYEEDEIPF